MVWHPSEVLSPKAAATSSVMWTQGLPPGTASYFAWHMGHPTTMRSASPAASCLFAISGAATLREFFPQQPGSFPTGSHPSARTMSSRASLCSMAAHPGSMETLSLFSSFGSPSMRERRNGMTCWHLTPWRIMISLQPAQRVNISLPPAVSSILVRYAKRSSSGMTPNCIGYMQQVKSGSSAALRPIPRHIAAAAYSTYGTTHLTVHPGMT